MANENFSFFNPQKRKLRSSELREIANIFEDPWNRGAAAQVWLCVKNLRSQYPERFSELQGVDVGEALDPNIGAIQDADLIGDVYVHLKEPIDKLSYGRCKKAKKTKRAGEMAAEEKKETERRKKLERKREKIATLIGEWASRLFAGMERKITERPEWFSKKRGDIKRIISRAPTLASTVDGMDVDVARKKMEEYEKEITAFVRKHSEDIYPVVEEALTGKYPLLLRLLLKKYIENKGLHEFQGDLLNRYKQKVPMRELRQSPLIYSFFIDQLRKILGAFKGVPKKVPKEVERLRRKIEKIGRKKRTAQGKLEEVRERLEKATQRAEKLEEKREEKPGKPSKKKKPRKKPKRKKKKPEKKGYKLVETVRGPRCSGPRGKFVSTAKCFKPIGKIELSEEGEKRYREVFGKEVEKQEEKIESVPYRKKPPFTPTYIPSEEPSRGYDKEEWERLIERYRETRWSKVVEKFRLVAKSLRGLSGPERVMKMDKQTEVTVRGKEIYIGQYYASKPPGWMKPFEGAPQHPPWKKGTVTRPKYITIPKKNVGFRRQTAEKMFGLNIAQMGNKIIFFSPGFLARTKGAGSIRSWAYFLNPWRIDKDRMLIAVIPETPAGSYTFLDPENPTFEVKA